MKVSTLAGILLASGGIAGSFPAQALSLTPASSPIATTDQTSALSASGLADLIDYTGSLTLLYKANVDSPEEGVAADLYATGFDLTPEDPSMATISWNGPASVIACPDCFLVVKDGNQSPAQYVFDLGDWDGQESLVLSDFWPAQGAISHVAIFGSAGLAPVPEAETYAMLLAGLGLVGLAVRRRRA